MAFPSQVRLTEDVDLAELASTYELSGSDIMNLVQHCCLQALQGGHAVMVQEQLIKAIKREFSKAGIM